MPQSRLNKDEIIQLAFLKLGEQHQLYHNNISDRLLIAEQLFNDIIVDLGSDATFTFNSRTIELDKFSNDTNFRGEFKYNKPNDYLSRVWTSDFKARIEAEYIWSKNDTLQLCYCYEMNLSDYPLYLKKLVVLKLAKRLAEVYDGYYQKIPMLDRDIIDETNRIVIQEGLPFPMER